MSEEPDYSSLPLDERAVHKEWKARQGAYQELTELFTKSANENDPNFQIYAQPDLFKKIVTDSNVVAQEAGITCLCKILEFGGPRVASKLRPVVTPLCEKSFVSSRAGTKAKATEALCLFIELLDSPDVVIEQILPFFSHKIPKVVATSVKSVTDILSQFGCKTCSVKPIIPLVPKLFGHADKNVRAEATSLSIEMYKWLGQSFEELVFADLKPVQQKDLKSAFDKIEDKPQQTRFLKCQQLQQEQQHQEHNDDGDVEMADSSESAAAGDAKEAPIDAYDLASPVDVLALIPADFYDQVAAVKWSERKEALETYYKSLQCVKMQDGNFTDLIRCLAKCIGKDANIQVVTVAANCVEAIAKGLRSHFAKYVSLVLPSILERTKEKKASVAEALASCLDAVFASSGFSHVTDDITKCLGHKTPQVKIATAHFLARCLQTTPHAPTRDEFETFLPSAVKLLSDSQEPVRSSATEAIGTLMKIAGERELNGYFDKVDENRLAKVKEFCASVTVTAKMQPVSSAPAQKSRHGQPQSARSGLSDQARTPALRPSSSLISRTIKQTTSNPAVGRQPMLKKPLANSLPSKRLATSPLKNDSRASLAGRASLGGSQTSRALQSSTLTSMNSPPLVHDSMTAAERQELESLRQEKLNWLKEREHLQWKLNDFTTRETRLMKEISSLQSKSETLMEEHTRDIINIKSKETQLSRLQNDLDMARSKIHNLETQVLDQQQLPAHAQQPSSAGDRPLSPVKSRYVSPFEDPNLGSDLSSKVKRLSIDNGDKENSSPQLDFAASKVDIDLDNNDDSWRRAAEVTSQLKARIEKMKARSRSNVSSFGSR